MTVRAPKIVSGPVSRHFRSIRYTLAKRDDDMTHLTMELRDPLNFGIEPEDNVRAFLDIPKGYKVTARIPEYCDENEISLSSLYEALIAHGLIIKHKTTLADSINASIEKL